MDISTDTDTPHEEARRIAAVRRYDVLDTPPDGAFDRITALAARRFGVPIAVVSIVDTDRIWFKSRHGLEVEEIGREPGLCASAIMKVAPHILPDAAADSVALSNPLVAGGFGLRFYAGVPLTTHDGHNLGVLCVIDRQPRTVSQEQIDDLRDLAATVMDQMELRLSARRAVAQAELMAREIDHRVMNSLQFVSSLLAMQCRMPDLSDAARHLEMAATRVSAVARVHRHFYLGGTETAACLAFLRRLCSDLSDICGCAVAVEGTESEVPSDMIQPIGLIVNELVTNAAKHGARHVDVAFRMAFGSYELSVGDDGRGLPEGFEPTAPAGLGLKVVGVLTDRIGGRLSCGPKGDGPGARFAVSFPSRQGGG